MAPEEVFEGCKALRGRSPRRLLGAGHLLVLCRCSLQGVLICEFPSGAIVICAPSNVCVVFSEKEEGS